MPESVVGVHTHSNCSKNKNVPSPLVSFAHVLNYGVGQTIPQVSCLEPLASSLYRISLGIRLLSFRLTWPSHRVEDVVWYTFLPRDTQNSPEVAQGKGVEPAFLGGESMTSCHRVEY